MNASRAFTTDDGRFYVATATLLSVLLALRFGQISPR
jgi:hypothetical protein